MKAFEEGMLKMIEELEFKGVNDEFQKSLKTDIDRTTRSKAVLVPADKSRNLYEMEKDQYEMLLHKNVTNTYRHAPAETCDDINEEAQKIATSLEVADRLDVLAHRDAFLTLKDHKENFPNSLPCRLNNPAKSEIGLISKRFLDRINRPSAVEELVRRHGVVFHNQRQALVRIHELRHLFVLSLHQRRLAVESIAFCSAIHGHLGRGD